VTLGAEERFRFLARKRDAAMTQASSHSWWNGRICPREDGAPSIASISFHLGTNVFDGMMAYWNKDHYYILRAEEHLLRFRKGAARMGMELLWSIEQMLTGIEELLELEPKGTQYVRPIAYRRESELWVTGAEGRPVDVSIFTVRIDGQRDVADPLRCQISPIERISSRSIPGQVKVSGAYVNSFHARKTAEASGFHDGLMFDRNGRLAEASAANVFLIKKERLLTPPLNPDVFPGITRQTILKLAQQEAIEVVEIDVRRDDLLTVDGAFLCSTLMEVRAVSLLDGRFLQTLELPLYRCVVDAFRGVTHK
jgi:branched-chain amino acid aminotransferase